MWGVGRSRWGIVFLPLFFLWIPCLSDLWMLDCLGSVLSLLLPPHLYSLAQACSELQTKIFNPLVNLLSIYLTGIPDSVCLGMDSWSPPAITCFYPSCPQSCSWFPLGSNTLSKILWLLGYLPTYTTITCSGHPWLLPHSRRGLLTHFSACPPGPSHDSNMGVREIFFRN